MAILRCTEKHRPAEDSHYRVYAQTAKEMACEVEGCSHLAVIWLDPEERREYTLGSRIFWERGSLTRVRVDGRPLTRLDEPFGRERPTPFPIRQWHRRRP